MLFHVAAGMYLPGELKQSSQWGKIASNFRHHGPDMMPETANIIVTETALETARMCLKPEAPSRLSCIYAWEKLKDAERFQLRYRPDSLIYAVEPSSPDLAIHRGDLGPFQRGYIHGGWVDHVPGDAKKYWTAEAVDLVEVLIGGAIRILDLVSKEDLNAPLRHALINDQKMVIKRVELPLRDDRAGVDVLRRRGG